MTILRLTLAVAGRATFTGCILAVMASLSPMLAIAEMAPAGGRMLIASRDLTDPNFSQTVILLIEHSVDGSMGIVVNRPTTITAREALPQIDDLEEYGGHVYFGGPVEVGSLVLLFRSSETPQDAKRVLENIHVSYDAALLEKLTAQGLGDSELRLYAGYAGWQAGQLDMEIAGGGWHVVPRKADLVFDQHPVDVWKELLPPPEPILAFTPPVATVRLP